MRTDLRVPAWTVDGTLAVGVAVTVSVLIASNHGGRHGPGGVAFLWAAGLGALMFARRRYPRLVLIVSVLGLFAYYAAGFPAIGLAVPLAAALFSAAEAGRPALAAGAAAVAVAVSLAFRLAEGQDAAYVVGYELAGHVALMAAAIALGDALRARRAQQAEQRRVTELTARQRERDAERRAHAERLAIARDLHDSLGHTVAVISLHADVAREAPGPPERNAALDVVKDAAGTALRELRRTVAVLRAPGEPPASPSLASLPELVAPAESAGLEVTTDVDVPGLPGTVDSAAYRIVQESVTNAVRHADAARLAVSARVSGGTLHLTVRDDGAADPGPPGHGIAGMTERARALGGTLTAAREPDGFVVRATLPLEEP
ncbi:sensor histidine kinase [Actinomadura flavalba]|uniref:sensor histidine kinase n=1 Tax=Actinomadura flavalba TaxID=1120938 RepID=UPI000370A471|nr:sensor histidine kinase [Actinomadura flavalba]